MSAGANQKSEVPELGMEFDIVRVALIEIGSHLELKVNLTFDAADYKKPLSVDFIDGRTGAMVSVPSELWAMLTEAITWKWEQ